MGIFLGYAQESKGYRILDPQSESVFEVRSIQLASRSDWPEPIFNRFGEQELPDTGITSELDSYQAESTSTSSSPPVSVTPNASAPVPMVSTPHPTPPVTPVPSSVTPVSPTATPIPSSQPVKRVRHASDFTNVIVSSANIIGDPDGPRQQRHRAKFVGGRRWALGTKGHQALHTPP